MIQASGKFHGRGMKKRKWHREDVVGEAQDKRLAENEYKAHLVRMQLSAEIDVVELARRVEAGPPEGIKQADANGVADGAGAIAGRESWLSPLAQAELERN